MFDVNSIIELLTFQLLTQMVILFKGVD